MPVPCRHIAGQAALDTPIMNAIGDENRMTAQLSRLIGLVVPLPDDSWDDLSEAGLYMQRATCATLMPAVTCAQSAL